MTVWLVVTFLGIVIQLTFLKCMQLSPHGRHPWFKDGIEAVYGPIEKTTYFERRAQAKKMSKMEEKLQERENRELLSADGIDIEVNTYRSNSRKGSVLSQK